MFDDKYIIKRFKNENLEQHEDGQFIETNRAAYLQKYAGKNTQMVPFYFGDVESGFMVNRFIDETVSKPKRNVKLELFGLYSKDVCWGVENGHNKINGYQIDYGGLTIFDATLQGNKEAQKTISNYINQSEEDQLKNLETANNFVKRFFIQQIKQYECKIKDDYALFNKILKNADDKTQAKLAAILQIPPEDKRFECFNKLFETKNEKVYENLAEKLYGLPADKRLECFNRLFETKNEKVYENLANNLCFLPEDKSLECFNILFDTKDEKMYENLARNFDGLPVDKNLECFNKLYKTKNENVYENLADNLYRLPKNKKLECFIKLFEIKNEKIHKNLVHQISKMPPKVQHEFNEKLNLISN